MGVKFHVQEDPWGGLGYGPVGFRKNVYLVQGRGGFVSPSVSRDYKGDREGIPHIHPIP